MKKKSWHLSRRLFLGGAGATIALPLFESMVRRPQPVARAATDTGVRLAFIYVPNGMIRTNLKPTAVGAGYTLPSGLASLADLQDDFCVLSGISNKPGGGSYTYPDGTTSSDGPGDHARDTGTFLTAARLKKTAGDDIRNGISVDQVAANALREFTPELPSIELATKEGSYGGDSGYAPIYKSNISWASETMPMPKETSPQAVFDRLFAGVDPTETAMEIERRRRLDQSVLDYCVDDMHDLERRLGARDREKLDEYLTSIEQLEVRLAGGGSGRSCDPGMRPGNPTDFREKTDLFYDLMTMAFQCDRTRVATMLLQKDNSVYDFVNVDGSNISSAHHQISHLDGGAADARKIMAINEWQMQSFGNFLRKLQSVTEAGGTTLLDNSLILFGGGMDATGDRDGDLISEASGPVHRHNNMPLFLGGRGGGAVTSGRHIEWTGDEPVADLYISMLEAAGVEVDSFGIEGTGPISQLAG